MINISHLETWGWEDVAREACKNRGIYKKHDKYEAYVCDKGTHSYLGCYATHEEAQEVIFKARCALFKTYLSANNEDIRNIRQIPNFNYFASTRGFIYNVRGWVMQGCINRCGYRQICFNGRTIEVHRLIASAFVPNPENKPCVNRKDGNKLNNSIDNLEWSTHSENTLHSFQNGLQKTVSGIPIYTKEEKDYMKAHCFEDYKDVATFLSRNSETVRKYMERYRREITNM